MFKRGYVVLKIINLINCILTWYLIFFTDFFTSGDTILDTFNKLGAILFSHGVTLFIFLLYKE